MRVQILYKLKYVSLNFVQTFVVSRGWYLMLSMASWLFVHHCFHINISLTSMTKYVEKIMTRHLLWIFMVSTNWLIFLLFLKTPLIFPEAPPWGQNLCTRNFKMYRTIDAWNIFMLPRGQHVEIHWGRSWCQWDKSFSFLLQHDSQDMFFF